LSGERDWVLIAIELESR